MAKYVVLLRDKRKGTLTRELLVEHIEHLRGLSRRGRLLLCGPFADDSGAFLLLETDSMEQAESIVRDDPFIRREYYRSFEVHELTESGEFNNWLLDDPQTKGNLRKSSP